MAVYMLLESVGRSPYRWEAPEDCALVGTLYMWECVRSTGKERMSKETCRKKSGKKRTSQACSRVLYQTGREVEKYREVSKGVERCLLY
jgi:hypothetical protein